MKYLLVSSLILSLSLFGFSTIINRKTTSVSNEKFTGATPRFTTDHRGNPVLSWVEKDGEKGHFYFTVSENGGQTFGKKIKINAPAELTVHAEGMPRVGVQRPLESKRLSTHRPKHDTIR